MWTERADALSIFRKWLDESTVVQCGLSLRVGSASLKGTIFSLTDDLVIVRSEDGSELRVDLGLAVCFGYDDTRKLPTMSAEFDAGLVVFFEDPTIVEYPESATFVEVRAER